MMVIRRHLTNNHFDVLVVDRQPPVAVDLLHLINEVQLHLARTEDAQDLLGVDRTDDQLVADLDASAVFNQQTRTLG